MLSDFNHTKGRVELVNWETIISLVSDIFVTFCCFLGLNTKPFVENTNNM